MRGHIMDNDKSDKIIYENKLLNDIVKIRKDVKEKELVVVEYLLDMIMVELLLLNNKTVNK
ncbi:MAG: hypothetical protein A4S15_09985 [Candidatus Raskinella chloraquaticus]|uniref:Uncharacterized protein n=2 Tax=Candidatus Raskinella chloraquaticus TaxID=1951219 RepID=A0A1W9HWK0_9HYPH|nr:MAG: hypothetical protein A4S15_09985 [Proteobacteria bacterium SG_bin8]